MRVQSTVDRNSDLGYVLDAQLVLYNALKYTQPAMRNDDIIHRLRSGHMQVQGNSFSTVTQITSSPHHVG